MLDAVFFIQGCGQTEWRWSTSSAETARRKTKSKVFFRRQVFIDHFAISDVFVVETNVMWSCF